MRALRCDGAAQQAWWGRARPSPARSSRRGGLGLTVSCSGRSHTGRATRITCKGPKGCASRKIQGLGKQQHKWDQDFTRACRKRKRSSPASVPAATIGGDGPGPSRMPVSRAAQAAACSAPIDRVPAFSRLAFVRGRRYPIYAGTLPLIVLSRGLVVLKMPIHDLHDDRA